MFHSMTNPMDQDPKHIDLFFPETNNNLKDSGWDAVLRWGYLKPFFAQKRRMPRHDFIDLRQDLRRIFNRLQCLPVAAMPKGCYKGSIWMEGKKGFQIWVNPDYYRLRKTVVVKGGGRSRRKKGLKSIPQQARDFANLRGLDKEVPHGSRQRFKAKILKDLDHSDGDDEDDAYEDTSKLKLPSKRALTVHNAPTGGSKVVQRDHMSGAMKNKRVPPKKQNTKMQLARRLLDNDSSDVVSIDSNSSDS